MTNPDLSLIGVLVDRSGSMITMRSDMQPALNAFLDGQKEAPGRCEMTLAQFDDVYEVVWTLRNIRDVPAYQLIPRNTTALLDAMGRFITEIGAVLAARAEADRPGKVIIVIVTDGLENASREWNRAQVRELVTQQHRDYRWEFVFLGANFDAIREAEGLGIARTSSLTYDGPRSPAAMSSAERHVRRLRANLSSEFSDEDRTNSKKRPRS
jgi:hypothetical protein